MRHVNVLADRSIHAGRQSGSAVAPCRSAVDNGHIRFVMALASGRCDVVQPFDLPSAQLDTVRGCVLFDASLSRPHDDRGCRATTCGLRRDRSRCQGPRRSMEVDLLNYAFAISDVRGDYLRDCDFRRFAGTPLQLLVTGFVVLAASNKPRMPCSNSSTALSKAPSCPTRTIATDKCNSNDGGRSTSTVPVNSFLPIKRAGSSPTPYPD